MMRHRQFDPYKKEADRKLAERGKEARKLREMGSARAFAASNASEVHASQTKRAKSVPVTLPKVW
jgi:hypothetical protein